MLRVIRKGLTFFVLVAMILSIASCGGGIPIVPNDPPVIQKVDGPDGGAVINQAAALFEWAGEDTMGARTIERYEIKKDSGTWQANTPITSTTYAWNNITEGTRSFSVRAVDDRGDVSNVLTWNFTYTIPEYTLTVQASPTAGGDIQIAAQGWQDTDTITVDENSQVQIQAQAANGYAFNGWYEGGLLLSQDNPLTVMVDTHRTVQAQFDDVPNTPPIVQKVDGPPVLITINHATFEWTGADAINTRAIVKYQYQKDAGAWTDMDPLTQTTYTWNNIAEGDHTFSVKAFDDEDAPSEPVTWNFTYTIPEYTLTVQASPTAGGDIQIAAQGWQDTDTITVDENTQVDLTAQATEGYVFEGWYEGQTLLSQQTTYTATVDANKTIWAYFKQLTRLRELGPEGNTNEPGNVYNIINNTFMGFWSVSVRISELPAEFQGATGWKLIVLGEEFEFTPNFVTADIYETNVEDTVTNNIEDIRNAFFVAEF